MNDNDFELTQDSSDEKYADQFDKVKPMDAVLEKYAANLDENESIFMKELIL
jgi:hypothetical protein